MDKFSPIFFALLAALLLTGSAHAQGNSQASQSGGESDRVDRRCTSTSLSTDASALCSDDALNSRSGVGHRVVRPPRHKTAGSHQAGAPTGNPSNPGRTGAPSGRTSAPAGAASREAVRGTTGIRHSVQ
jgi:hypothetical protein